MAIQASIPFFSDYSCLEYFLKTNNYWAYYQKILPPLLLQKLEHKGHVQRGTLCVLDIGCGCGDFSIPIFEELARRFRVEVTAFDPSADAIASYQRGYSIPRKSVLVEASTHSFETFPETNSFDLVLAAHSLYATFETRSDPVSAGAKVCRKLRLLTAPSGLTCTIMAANDSMLYEVKRQAYTILGDPDHFMMTGDLLGEYMRKDGMLFERWIADTYVDVSAFFTENQGSLDPIWWLSYLLRIDVANLGGELRGRLVALVKKRALRFGALPESIKSVYLDCHALTGAPSNETRVLFHKETVLTSQV